MAAQSFTAEIAYILGRGARLVARGWRYCEHHVAGWLVANGVAPSAAQLLLDGTKFAVLGVLFYSATWLLLIAAAMLVISKLDGRAAASEGVDEWPITTYSELRNTPGYDPNLYNDISHEQYVDN